jgi:hypothetical protein
MKTGKRHVFFWSAHPLLWPIIFLAAIVLVLKMIPLHETPQPNHNFAIPTTAISN